MDNDINSSLIGQRNLRLSKLRKLRELGFDPFPAKSNKELTVAEFLSRFDEFTNKSTLVAGRLTSLRGHGKIAFSNIKDSTGSIQIFLQENLLPISDSNLQTLSFKHFKELIDIGDFIEVTGKSTTTQAGEKTVLVEKIRLLTKSLRPIPRTHEEINDVELLYRRRYLDTNINQDKFDRFVRRSKFWEAHRDFFKQNGFIEINIPVLEHLTGGADANPFVTHMDSLDEDFYLRISQELYLKRLIGGGYDKVYEIGPRFRNEGMSDEHLPEHISMEFYWAYADWQDGMKFITELFRYVYDKVYGKLNFKIRGFDVDLSKDWEIIDYATVIKQNYNIDIFNTNLEQIIAALKSKGINTDADLNLNRGIDQLWKNLRKDIAGPAFLVGEPKFLSPLAKSDPNNPLITQRFHPIIAGSELGNAFSELNDPEDQLQRFLEQQQMRDKGDKEAQMLDIDFVEMLEYGMPPTFGYGHSERNFWFFEDAPAKDCVPFPPLRYKVSDVTKKIYPSIFANNLVKDNKEIKNNNSVSQKNEIQSSPIKIDRQKYLEATQKQLEPNIFYHSLALEACMGGIYDYLKSQNQLSSNELSREEWTLAGLIHDIDYSGEHKPNHPNKTKDVLDMYNLELPDSVDQIVKAHAPELTGINAESKAQWAIFCADSLTGLITAVAFVYPSRKLADVKTSSVLKRFLKEPKFAAGTRRDEVKMCELPEGLNIPLEKFIEICLTSIQSIASEIGL